MFYLLLHYFAFIHFVLPSSDHLIKVAKCRSVCLHYLSFRRVVERYDGKADISYCWDNCHQNSENHQLCFSGCRTHSVKPNLSRSQLTLPGVKKVVMHLTGFFQTQVHFLNVNQQIQFHPGNVHFICMNLVGNIESPSAIALYRINDDQSILQGPTVYVVESRQKVWSSTDNSFETSTWTRADQLFSLQPLLPNQFYQVRVTAVQQINNVVLGFESGWQQMLIGDSDSEAVLGPVSSLKIKEQILHPQHGLTAIISWKPNEHYPSCFYHLFWTNNLTSSTKSLLVEGKFEYGITGLAYNSNYTVMIRSLSSAKIVRLESSSVSVQFHTNDCLSMHQFNFSECAPGSVRNVTLQFDNGSAFVSWKPPKYYDQPINENKNLTVKLENVTVGCQYSVEIFANTTAGIGKGQRIYFNSSKAIDLQSTARTSFNLKYLILIPTGFAVVIVVIVVVMQRRGRPSLLRKPSVAYEFAGSEVPFFTHSVSTSAASLPNRPERIKDLLDYVHCDVILGEGTFGCVYRAICHAPGLPQIVAVKTLKREFGNESKEAEKHLLKEIELLRRLRPHPNVTKYLGYCSRPDALILVLEYCPQGNLKNYLKKLVKGKHSSLSCTIRNRLNPLSTDDISFSSNKTPYRISNWRPLFYGHQIALGMQHLAAQGLVHRDLAARNILVADDGRQVKVSDFGLSRTGGNYQQLFGARLPVKWMAPESIFNYFFSTKSDVWSFGVVLWEIAKFGDDPYPGIELPQLLDLLKSGYHMPQPDGCDTALYKLMVKCWNKDADLRPTFSDIRIQLELQLHLKAAGFGCPMEQHRNVTKETNYLRKVWQRRKIAVSCAQNELKIQQQIREQFVASWRKRHINKEKLRPFVPRVDYS
ncbi:Fibroblast growth factor receptor [Trichinella spiralis]|uniref:receptor protein-tyrosine kinase n=1 Tax=Trichinella spiralis TaxID=6334 RepID=A0A0V1BAR0_TRISP|nr:Fibroblast growth factor receptor [Trichinella spiralis]